ncbi:hypothetical protein HDR63_04000 [bacterium]|nr:hypothetical protein [bacterium]
MSNARENNQPTQLLTPRAFDIAGNDIVAYYDAAGKLVFVLDQTVGPTKPNVLLVINPVGDRKWDDILANDYNMDLETVRPKRDNKYQKLDIEYGGLGAYDRLISAARDGGDTRDAVAELNAVRDASIRRSAHARLVAANATADKARDTIVKTNDTIAELTAHLKALRAKLTQNRRDIGREPTKQSAAKILRTEAQIDATNDKLRRAKKRLINAQRRLAAAEEDADAAQRILDMTPDAPAARPETGAGRGTLPGAPIFTEMAPIDVPAMPAADDDATDDTDDDDDAIAPVPNDVQPLFDRDPQIMDEAIAFKPIEFDVPETRAVATPAPTQVEPVRDIVIDDEPVVKFEPLDVTPDIAPAPLSFVPPETKTEKSIDAPAELNIAPVFEPISTPVLDTMIPIADAAPVAPVPDETPAPISVIPVVDREIAVTPVIDPIPDAPVLSSDASDTTVAADTTPDIAPAPITSDMRPVSPITGTDTPKNAATRTGRPSALYYIMLIILIALSIFTLWLYQKRAPATVPDLAAPVATTTASASRPHITVATPEPVPTVAQTAPAPVTQGNDNPFLGSVPVVEPMPDPDLAPTAEYISDTDVVTTDDMGPTWDDETDMDVPPVDVPVVSDDVIYQTVDMGPDDIDITPQNGVNMMPDMAAAPAPFDKPVYDVSAQGRTIVPAPTYDDDYYYDDTDYTDMAF